jgi:hypothetical protein
VWAPLSQTPAAALRPLLTFGHKPARPQDAAVKLGAWQMVLWQPRFVFAEIDGLCYQKVSTNDKPIGKPKKVAFSSVNKIDELEYGEFVVQCTGRDYTFKAVDTNQCTVMVHNLRQLLSRYRESRMDAKASEQQLRPSRVSAKAK